MIFGIDDNRNPAITAAPDQLALAITYDATISASTAVTLNTATKFVEVTAIDKPVLLKWGGTASTSAFDGVVAQNTSKMFPVPVGQTSVQFIEESATAKLVVIEYA